MTAPSYTKFEILLPPKRIVRNTVPAESICVTASDPVAPTQTEPFARMTLVGCVPTLVYPNIAPVVGLMRATLASLNNVTQRFVPSNMDDARFEPESVMVRVTAPVETSMSVTVLPEVPVTNR